jgi:hypothetical protein
MALSALEKIRAKLESMENKSSGNSPVSSDNALYPHWNIEEGQTATVRFLPDQDPDNVFFWEERQMIKLSFPGVKGGDNNKPVTVQVPCGEMYGDTCPVLTEVRPWFKDPSLEDLARKYWKKRSYLFQGFVVENPMNEDNTPENPIRRFVISPQIYKIIKAALMDPDMESLPVDYVNGTDFRISKTQSGKYADYNMSNWSRRERALTEKELSAIEEFGLYNLKDFLPARPTEEHYTAIKEMFEASVDGELYDPARWGNYYKPYGVEVPSDAPQPGLQKTEAPVSKTTPIVTEVSTDDQDIPWESETPAATTVKETATSSEPGKKSADDILAMIRNRNAQ